MEDFVAENTNIPNRSTPNKYSGRPKKDHYSYYDDEEEL